MTTAVCFYKTPTDKVWWKERTNRKLSGQTRSSHTLTPIKHHF